MNNRIIGKLFVACCLALITLPATAQKSKNALSDAFAEFTGKLIKDRQVTQVTNNIYSDGYIQEYHFEAPVATVQKFDKAMTAKAQNAYISFMKTAGTSSPGNTSRNIAYGEDNKESRIVNYDRDSNYNLLFLQDTKDKTKRYAYVLAWKKDNGKVSGYAIKVYGRDPRQNTAAITETKIIDKPSNSQEFMQSFGNLRSLFIKQNEYLALELQYNRSFGRKTSNKLPLLTGIANKISALCNDYGNLLKSPSKELVKQTLKELQEQSKDKYVGSLLGICYENL